MASWHSTAGMMFSCPRCGELTHLEIRDGVLKPSKVRPAIRCRKCDTAFKLTAMEMVLEDDDQEQLV